MEALRPSLDEASHGKDLNTKVWNIYIYIYIYIRTYVHTYICVVCVCVCVYSTLRHAHTQYVCIHIIYTHTNTQEAALDYIGRRALGQTTSRANRIKHAQEIVIRELLPHIGITGVFVCVCV